jgi:hypothetical protein
MACIKCGGRGRQDLYLEGLWRCAMCSTPLKGQPLNSCPECFNYFTELIRVKKELEQATDFIAKITALVICAKENNGCDHIPQLK